MMAQDEKTMNPEEETPSDKAIRKIAESFGCDLETAKEIYDIADVVISID